MLLFYIFSNIENMAKDMVPLEWFYLLSCTAHVKAYGKNMVTPKIGSCLGCY